MAAIDPAEEIKELSAKLTGVETVLDLDAMRREVAELRDQAADRRLWDDQERAQTVTRKLSHFESELGRVESLRRRLDDLPIMLDLAESEDDEPTRQEAERELGALRKEIDQLEIRTLMSREYDAREALITINAQAGGADAADWAQTLQRIYLRWAERHGYPTEVYDTSYAEEAGIKSTTFAGQAGRASTRPILPCGSRTCPPGSWSPARTSAANFRTAPPPWLCSRPSCLSASARRTRPR